MKKKLLAAVAGLTLLATSQAFGFSLLVPDYQGPVKFKYTNYESQVTQVGQELFGIFQITSIQADTPANTMLWYSGYNGEELTGTFSNYTLANITPIPGGLAADFTGGIVNMYLDNTPDFNANPYPTGTGVTDGSLFLSFVGASGFVTDDPGTAYDESQDTLRSTLDALTTPFTGKGEGRLQVTGGAYASMFGFPDFAPVIMSLSSDLASPDPSKSEWPVGSEDPLRGTIVPEPGTFVLLGAGLAGLGFLRRKQNRK